MILLISIVTVYSEAIPFGRDLFSFPSRNYDYFHDMRDSLPVTIISYFHAIYFSRPGMFFQYRRKSWSPIFIYDAFQVAVSAYSELFITRGRRMTRHAPSPLEGRQGDETLTPASICRISQNNINMLKLAARATVLYTPKAWAWHYLRPHYQLSPWPIRPLPP